MWVGWGGGGGLARASTQVKDEEVSSENEIHSRYFKFPMISENYTFLLKRAERVHATIRIGSVVRVTGLQLIKNAGSVSVRWVFLDLWQA